MAKKNEIRHSGRIIEITPDFTTVQIVVSSACSSCHAKAMCGMSEDEEKVIMVPFTLSHGVGLWLIYNEIFLYRAQHTELDGQFVQ